MVAQAQPPADASVPDAPEPPKLVCDAGTTLMMAPAPEPTWFCGREHNVRHGPFITQFPDGTNEIEGTYANGKLDGPWQRHYPSGSIAESGAFANGQKDGHWKQLNTSGATLGEYEMKAGTGTEKHWYDDGPIYSERALRGGVPNGTFKIYEHDGNPAVTAKFVANRLDGSHVVGAKNTLRIEETFTNGVRHDARQIWQFWLLVVDEAYDKHGKLDGPFTIWRDKKIPRVQGTYDHGKRTGTWSWFDRNNNKEREGDFADGKKTGAWFEWYENKLTYSGNYTDGMADGEFIYYDKSANELGRFEVKDGTGTMQTFHPNHKPATKAHVYKGGCSTACIRSSRRAARSWSKRHYIGRSASTAGGANGPISALLTLEERWKYGRLDGAFKKYEAGKLAVETTYKNGKVDGAYTEYRNGKPGMTGQFVSDRRDGTWTEYNAEGAVVMTATYKDGVLDGPWRQLVDGVVFEGAMVAGRRSGTWTRTDKSGAAQAITYQPK